MQWNAALFAAMHGLFGNNALAARAVLFFADSLTYLLVAGLFVFLFRLKIWRTRAFWAGEMILAYLFARWFIAAWVQYLFPRERPFMVLGFDPPFLPMTAASFPSAHMVSLFAITAVLWAVNRKWGLAYALLSLLVGLGRIMAGVHWPLDIIGGILIGALSGLIVHELVRKYQIHST